ncbi:MAG: N-succinylarginine dihydrolase [Bdellovibrionales bacterium]|nr:N-succinylarginine dihydrolase [Bdellovibrionales bacterium]
MKKTYPKAEEYNFDGLVGPTHNYAGLAIGNTASMKNKDEVSHPRAAALEGLEKMKFLMDRGFKQAVLPPHERPDLRFLRTLGLTGSDETLLKSTASLSPALLATCYSASSMWTANSTTISPSADTQDGKVHLTPANLHSYLHRSLETEQTQIILKKIFSDSRYFVHHSPLPSLPAFADEGAANHNRLCHEYGKPGVEAFVYGRSGFFSAKETVVFHPRQTREASRLIALHHQLKTEKIILVQQNPKAIDAGVFHNDVICTADKNLIFYHEFSFVNTEGTLKEIEQKLLPDPLFKIPVKAKDISLQEAVSSYLFNSQLLPQGKESWILLAPKECEDQPSIREYLQSLPNNLIREVCFIPIRQSMQNGGGPACLRLRVVLTEEEAGAIHPGVILNSELYEKLKHWIEKHYRDRLEPKDLLDPLLIRESREALDELSRILQLQNIYPFQQ